MLFLLQKFQTNENYRTNSVAVVSIQLLLSSSSTRSSSHRIRFLADQERDIARRVANVGVQRHHPRASNRALKMRFQMADP
jgi:hypothetical protein